MSLLKKFTVKTFIDCCRITDIVVSPEVLRDVKEYFNEKNIDYKILIADLQVQYFFLNAIFSMQKISRIFNHKNILLEINNKSKSKSG